jgi:hypothetical protein
MVDGNHVLTIISIYMELYLQFGHGMMDHCRHLIQSWNGGTVILSPRDIKETRLQNFSREITGLPGGEVLFDPQLYVPRCDHQQLCSYSYWPNNYATGVFWQGGPLRALLSGLLDLNTSIASSAFVLPGTLASEINDDWLDVQSSIISEASQMCGDMELYATIALSDQSMLQEEQIAKLLEKTENWNVAGYYLVCQHPRGEYLVNNPIWVSNVLDIVAGLRLSGAKVILGYCSHQMLIAAVSKVTAICSGNFLNVRSFPPDKFKITESEPKQRSTWYYCPQALSEYKDSFLDIAHRLGVLDDLRPDEVFGGYANRLFTGPQPTTLGFKEPVAFRHYLNSLHVQAAQAECATFDETIDLYHQMLLRTEDILHNLHNVGISGRPRDFIDIVDVQRAALAVHTTTRGPVLRRRWSSL